MFGAAVHPKRPTRCDNVYTYPYSLFTLLVWKCSIAKIGKETGLVAKVADWRDLSPISGRHLVKHEDQADWYNRRTHQKIHFGAKNRDCPRQFMRFICECFVELSAHS